MMDKPTTQQAEQDAEPPSYELSRRPRYKGEYIQQRTDGTLDPAFVAWFKWETARRNAGKGEGQR